MSLVARKDVLHWIVLIKAGLPVAGHFWYYYTHLPYVIDILVIFVLETCTQCWLIIYFIISDDSGTALVTIPPEYCDATIMDPFLGQVFHEDTDGFQFYNMYALRNGFGIRIRKQVKNVAGDTTYIEFVWSCEVCTTYRLSLKLK